MRAILPVIVFSQFFCTSLWFAGNAILPELAKEFHPGPHFLAHLTSAIQFGFISGTLVFAVFTISDRFSPSRVFFISAILAALFNLGLSISTILPSELLFCRFFTGFFLAGIYPVGMKIVSDHYQAGLGKSLGFLVGALVLGTSFPHLLKTFTSGIPWKYDVYITSALSFSGGLGILLFVPDGPFRKPAQKLNFTAFINGFKKPDFRAPAFGYFGHMWELYTFWAFVPVMLSTYNTRHLDANLNVPLLSFLIIAFGSIACFFSGILSRHFSVKKAAVFYLFISCLCCILSPVFLFSSSSVLLLIFLFVWGLAVIADSPLFATLVSQSAPEESRGASLTFVNCIGFSITIVSIQLISFLSDKINTQYIYMLLAIGPVLGLIALKNKKQ
jgi:MFS family permease